MHAGAVGTNEAPGNTEGEKPAYVLGFKKKGQRFSGTVLTTCYTQLFMFIFMSSFASFANALLPHMFIRPLRTLSLPPRTLPFTPGI